jgi:hypothetical protein
MFNNLHPTAVILIQHPLWDQNLHSTRECYLTWCSPKEEHFRILVTVAP